MFKKQAKRVEVAAQSNVFDKVFRSPDLVTLDLYGTLYNLVDRQGRPFPGHIQEGLSEAITTAISDHEADVDVIVRTAQGIGEQVPQKNIVDLVRYATKALFKASKRSRLQRISIAKEVALPGKLEVAVNVAAGRACGAPGRMRRR